MNYENNLYTPVVLSLSSAHHKLLTVDLYLFGFVEVLLKLHDIFVSHLEPHDCRQRLKK